MEESKFSIGAIIIYTEDHSSSELENGHSYEVSGLTIKFNVPCVELVGHTGFWYESRFELYSTPTKYEVGTSFGIVDIFEKSPCGDQFLALLKEPRRMGKKFGSFQDIKNCPTLMRNLEWLEKNGFITKVKEKWINLYLGRDNKPYIGSNTFDSKQAAKKGSSPYGDTYVGAAVRN